MKRSFIIALVAVSAASLAFGACASSNKSAKSSKSAESSNDHAVAVMTWDEVKAAQANGAVLVDARGPDSYAKGHIPGAIHAAARDEGAVSKLPADKNVQLITYCGGPQCSASAKVAERAMAAGYKHVAEYKGGYPEWADKHGLSKEAAARPVPEGVKVMTWDEVAAAMANGAVLVDARSAEGYAKGHIAGAINVPYKNADAYAALPADKASTVIFYCGGPACSASSKGAETALEHGYKSVGEYRGGYPEWASRQ